MAEDSSDISTLELATELTIAWLSNANTRASVDEVPEFLNKMHQAVISMAAPQTEEAPVQEEYAPAVSARKSLASRDHIISMIDGRPYKTLRRHLSGHGLTPDQYRERYGLRPDYPMVAESYSQVRRDMAKKIGLGRKSTRAAAPEPEVASAPAKRRASPRAAPEPEVESAPTKKRGRPKKVQPEQV